jgi:hypothetical protein
VNPGCPDEGCVPAPSYAAEQLAKPLADVVVQHVIESVCRLERLRGVASRNLIVFIATVGDEDPGHAQLYQLLCLPSNLIITDTHAIPPHITNRLVKLHVQRPTQPLASPCPRASIFQFVLLVNQCRDACQPHQPVLQLDQRLALKTCSLTVCLSPVLLG